MSEPTVSPSAYRATSATGTPFLLRARPLAFLLLLLLGAQFLLGMVTNLFVQVPTAHPGRDAPNYFLGVLQGLGWAITQGALFLQLHVLLGLALIIAGGLLIAVAFRTRALVWMICAPIGAFGMLGAGFNGASFLDFPGQDISSLIMALLALGALCCYLLALYMLPVAATK